MKIQSLKLTNFRQFEQLDVEHVVPKAKDPDLELEWSNFLLGCARCNRDFKRSKNDNRVDYVWPDTDNTFALLTYWEDGRVKPVNGLSDSMQTQVENIIALVCLDDGDKDQQVLNISQRTKFKIAKKAKGDFVDGNCNVEDILLQASEGFWSVWVTVFSELPDVVQALKTSEDYPNTALERAIP